jgi:alpha-ketoglutarate-dependent 2,4-dichlorophenoxyacetate dioxygenase
MALTVERLHPLFAAELSGIDLREAVDDALVREFRAAMAEYAVCVVHHDTPPTNEQHIAFSAQLGPIEGRQVLKVTGADGMRIPHHEIIDQSNLDETGEIYGDDDRRLMFKRANRQWHTDMSFHPIRATYSLLAGHIVPSDGADTEFVDMRAVYEALPDALKTRIEGLVAEHSYWHSRVTGGGPEPTEEERRSRPPARHQLVHVHDGSGRKTLYLASHATHIGGWPIDEGRALLGELMDFATQQRFIYRHKWRVGDVVIWDNLCSMHRATPFDDRTHRRDMRRTTCREAPVPSEAVA